MTATTERPVSTPSPSYRLDNSTQLRDIIRSLPREVFEKNRFKAWRSVAITIAASIAGFAAIAFSPWYLLPFAWFFTGTALTGFFVIGHDCAHRSFAKKVWVNDIVGHLAMLPLIYPFHGWRIHHDTHHLYTNKLDVDNAWHPWSEDKYKTENPAVSRLYKALRGAFWWIASIFHWAMHHFNPASVKERERAKFTFSAAFVVVGAAIAFPTMIWTLGVWGFVKFWVMPWLGYHFWMSTFTIVHHTAPNIQFFPEDDWNAAQSQLAGTVHCDYPQWVEVLCHDINVHIPHHISVGIPSYNLRAAHASLKENWGEYLIETKFNWDMMKHVIQECHIYHPETAYVPFSAVES